MKVGGRLPLLGIESAGESAHDLTLHANRLMAHRVISASFSERAKTGFMPCSWHEADAMQAADQRSE
jgi:hypothetical protein